MNSPPARIVVADDHALVRTGICALLDGHDDLTVVGQTSTGADTITLTRQLRPDLVLMDLRMPGGDGVQATRDITAGYAEDDLQPVLVLVLTTFADDASVHAALAAGASGFLVKDTAPTQLLPAVRTVLSGQSWLDPAVADQVLRAIRSTPQQTTPDSELVGRLTERERQILVRMARGLTNTQIGDELTLSPATVRTHVSRILMKTGCHDRTQAVVLAYSTRLVVPRRP